MQGEYKRRIPENCCLRVPIGLPQAFRCRAEQPWNGSMPRRSLDGCKAGFRGTGKIWPGFAEPKIGGIERYPEGGDRTS